MLADADGASMPVGVVYCGCCEQRGLAMLAWGRWRKNGIGLGLFPSERTDLAAIARRRGGTTVAAWCIIIRMSTHASGFTAMLGRIDGPPRRGRGACAMRSPIRGTLRKARPRPSSWPLLHLPVGRHRLIAVARPGRGLMLGWCVWMMCDGLAGRTAGTIAERGAGRE